MFQDKLMGQCIQGISIKKVISRKSDSGSERVGLFPRFPLSSVIVSQGIVKCSYRELGTVMMVWGKRFQIVYYINYFDIPCLIKAFSFCKNRYSIAAGNSVCTSIHPKGNQVDVFSFYNEKNLYGITAYSFANAIAIGFFQTAISI